MTQALSLFSIGYATKPMAEYLEQLKRNQVDVVADIRSVPYSKAFHDYHQEALQQSLRQQGIRYVYLGLELGPRSKDPAHYDAEGQVQFDRLRKSQLFQQGLTRLFQGLDKGFRIALSCAEKDPAICHRSLLVGYDLLHDHKRQLQHIRHDGALELQSDLEQRLLALTGTVPDMLMREEEARQVAYRKQCLAYAYRRP